MHIQTHIMSGWCIGNLLPFNARERLFCMLAASLSDVDGLGIVFGQEAYWDYHHVVGHNLLFGLILSAVLCCFSAHRAIAMPAYLALFHLHLLMDYFGSGPGWGIPYFWPKSSHVYLSQHTWVFYSWQNLTSAGVLLIWTLLLIRMKGRTPLEAIMPSLDRQLVRKLQRRPENSANH